MTKKSIVWSDPDGEFETVSVADFCRNGLPMDDSREPIKIIVGVKDEESGVVEDFLDYYLVYENGVFQSLMEASYAGPLFQLNGEHMEAELQKMDFVDLSDEDDFDEDE